jgi:hypothetical protein
MEMGKITCLIPLTNGFYAKVDELDYENLMQFKWCVNKGAKNSTFYAVRGIHRGNVRYREFMHRVIMNVAPGQIVDHINHDTLDNRRENLRIGRQAQNLLNRLTDCNSSSKYKGVSLWKGNGRWLAQYRGIRIGYFKEEKDAAQAYNAIAFKDNPDWILLNEIEGLTREQSVIMPQSYNPRIKKTRYKGVRQRSKNSWQAYLQYDKRREVIGYYKTEIEAAIAYNVKCIEFGLTHKLNNIEEIPES